MVEKRGENYIWEGDIILSEEQFKSLNSYGTLQRDKPEYLGPEKGIHPVLGIPTVGTSGQGAVARSFSISPSPYYLWSMVRFTYGSNLSSTDRFRIGNALYDMESNSNVRFYNETGKPTIDPDYGFEYPYIEFIRAEDDDVSTSNLGRIGGEQNIAFTANYSNGTIIHEICHSIGMRHEHTRTDRNSNVTVNFSNLTSRGASAFQIPSTNYYQEGSYDFSSIMGYFSTTYSVSIVHDTSEPMYTKLDGSHIYRGSSISVNDRKWINRFYSPYITRSDVYAELDDVVYNPDNSIMTTQQRMNLQAQLNNEIRPLLTAVGYQIIFKKPKRMPSWTSFFMSAN